MSQPSFDFPLTSFEQATADTYIHFKISKKKDESEQELNDRVAAKMASSSFKNEVIGIVNRWQLNRIKTGLKPFK